MKNTTNFPPGWDEGRVRHLLHHSESLTEEEAGAEDEAAFEDTAQTVMEIPNDWFHPSERCSRNTPNDFR